MRWYYENQKTAGKFLYIRFPYNNSIYRPSSTINGLYKFL